ncbi:MAG TPA: hypothetical protein VGP92_12655 [Acidimicrobiia bacterium]|nr:hypothetical protein [Acidimicrobiia bacterium]
MFILGAAACAGVITSGTTPAWASCVGPELNLAVTRGAPGSTVAVSGRYFFATCNDTVVNGVQPPPNAPATDVGIVFVQDGRRTPLRSFPAQADGSFAVTVAIPSTARSGAAQFEATGGFNPVSQNFTVVTGAPELAFTGSGTSRLAMLGFAALAGALILFGISRRRALTP